jgi:hypothetical protein
MASACSEDLKRFLVADTDVPKKVGTRIHQNEVPPATPVPYIFFAQADHSSEGALNDSAGLDPYSRTFDLEVWAQSIRDAEVIEEYVTNRLNHARGSFGLGTVQGVFVTGQPNDYIPKGIGSGRGYHGANLLVEVKGHVGG